MRIGDGLSAAAELCKEGDGVIEIDHLTKCYGPHTAVRDLSLRVEPGRIYGLLGPNGAGKSTTMNIMTGCLAATSGSVRIDGHDIFEEPEQAKALIGYLPELPPLYPEMTPAEYLDFVAQAKGVKREERAGQIEKAMRTTRIDNVADRLIRNLSKGYRQRVGIAQALLGSPKVIILDEPTVGLDPQQIIEIRDLIRTLRNSHTVILSSHILSEVRAVCDEIVIISKGQLVASDTPENLERLFAGGGTLELTVRGEEKQARQVLGTLPGVGAVKITAKKPGGLLQLELETTSSTDPSESVFFACADARMPILQMGMHRASLEAVFIELTSADQGSQPEQGEEEVPS